MTFEHEKEDDPKSLVRMISPLKFDHPTDEIAVKFEPFYLYESVTANVLDEVEHLSGW